MKRGIIESYSEKQLRFKRVTKGIIITGLIMFLIIAVSFYGQYVGNFVIRMDNPGEKRGISLCEKADLQNLTTRLTAQPLNHATDTAYNLIPEDIEEGDGSKNAIDRTYFAYSFYIINVGNQTVDYRIKLNLEKATRNVDSIMRIMLIKDGNKEVYAKPQEGGDEDGQPEYIRFGYGEEDILGVTIPFSGEQEVFNKLVTDFAPNTNSKYTIVMWLDGWDAQSDNSKLGSSLRLSLDFTLAV